MGTFLDPFCITRHKIRVLTLTSNPDKGSATETKGQSLLVINSDIKS